MTATSAAAGDAGLANAYAALATDDVEGAVAILTDAIAALDLPEAQLLLGELLDLSQDFASSRTHMEAAYRGFKRIADPRGAARAATSLGAQYYSSGNEPASRTWFTRAERLLDELGPCPERGYLELAIVGCWRPDAAGLERSARLALDLARQFDDVDLECQGHANLGLALVSQGHIEAGMAELDEALTIVVSGEVRSTKMSGTAVCCLLTACERAGDLPRAEAWVRTIEELTAQGCHRRWAPLFGHCRLAYGAVLCELGHWPEAEATLRVATEVNHRSWFLRRAESVAALANLLLQQGRLDDARSLLTGLDDRIEVTLPLARLHLADGEHALASAVSSGALQQLVDDRLRSAPLLSVLVESELGRGDIDRARDAAARLAALAAGAEGPASRAEAALALGRVAARCGDTAAAIAHVEEGLSCLRGLERPLLTAQLHLEMARVMEAVDPAVAVREARAGLAIFERLGAARDGDAAAALLRRLGVTAQASKPLSSTVPSVATPGGVEQLSRREREVLELLGSGLSNAEIAHKLFISPRTAEHHVASILAKLGARSRAAAAVYALKQAAAAG